MRRLLGTLAILLCLVVSAQPIAADEQAFQEQKQIFLVSLQSKVLTQFFKAPMSIHAQILLPDSYYKDPTRKYPTLYWLPAFEAPFELDAGMRNQFQRAMRESHVELIVVSMEGSFGGMDPEYADSASFGPWGAALVDEFIPITEARFRAISSGDSRFVAGHSSGGWSSLWLQVNYPMMFGGAWSISPDPVDFHDFTGPDLTARPPGNFYRDAAGRDYGINQAPWTMAALAEDPNWGWRQLKSFEWVFSPPGTDGQPQPLFDRKTGVIDPDVAEYWEDHYDISRILRDRWPELGPKLRGKLHVMVCAHDTFHLDRPVRLLQQELTTLGSDAEIDIPPCGDHWEIYSWHGGLIHYIVGEIGDRLAATNGVQASP